MSSLEAERTYLQKEKVSDHLGKLIDRVTRERPQDTYGLMEILSRLIKAELEPVADAEASPAATEPDSAVMEEYVKKVRKLDLAPKDEGGELVSLSSQMPDFVRQAEMLSWAGFGFGPLESYQIMCSLRNLNNAKAEDGLEKIRFWGKVLGSEADYWVAEAQRPEGGELPEGEDETTMEPPGAPGANQFAFYVTNDLAGSWQKLPEVRPREIVAARAIRRILTGNANAKVISHPHFEGNEAVLLRAQIARISADTVLCIKGFLKGEDEEEADNEDEEFAAKPPAELGTLDGWTHCRKHLLKSGKTAHPELGDDMEEADEAKLKEEISLDPPKDENRGLRGDELEWSIKQAGDCTEYTDPLQSNLVSSVRSLTWPGAVSVANGKQFINAYVGYAMPAREPQFYPPEPPDIQEEPEDSGDQLQPPGTEEVEDAPPDENADE